MKVVVFVGETSAVTEARPWILRWLGGLDGTVVLTNSFDVMPDVVVVCGMPTDSGWRALAKSLSCARVWVELEPVNSTDAAAIDADICLRLQTQVGKRDCVVPAWLRRIESRISNKHSFKLDELLPERTTDAGQREFARQLAEASENWERVLQSYRDHESVSIRTQLQSLAIAARDAATVESARLWTKAGLPERAVDVLVRSKLADETGQGGSSKIKLDAVFELASASLAIPSRIGETRDRVWAQLQESECARDPRWLTLAAHVSTMPAIAIDISRHIPMNIVNLTRRRDRWLQFQRQLDQLSQLSRLRIFARRNEAVDGLDLKARGLDAIRPCFRPQETKNTSKALLPWGAIGCFMSHYNAWKSFAATPESEIGDWEFEGEDDAVFGPMFLRDWAMLERICPYLGAHWDVIWLGYHLPPETRWRDAIMNTAPRRFMLSGQNRVQGGIGGTFGYLVSRRGARKLVQLLDAAEPHSISIGVDTWMFRNSSLCQLTLDPPTVLSHYFLPNDPATHDSDCAQ